MKSNRKNNGFVCPDCGNNRFYASQDCIHSVVVDGNNRFVKDIGVVEGDKAYGTYQCTKCGKEFEDLG